MSRFRPGESGNPSGRPAAESQIPADLALQVADLRESALRRLQIAVDSGARWAIEAVLAQTVPRARAISWDGRSLPDGVATRLAATRRGQQVALDAVILGITQAAYTEVDIEQLTDTIARHPRRAVSGSEPPAEAGGED